MFSKWVSQRQLVGHLVNWMLACIALLLVQKGLLLLCCIGCGTGSGRRRGRDAYCCLAADTLQKCLILSRVFTSQYASRLNPILLNSCIPTCFCRIPEIFFSPQTFYFILFYLCVTFLSELIPKMAYRTM